MAAPSYVSDLTTINDGSGTFTEPASAILGTLSNVDTDNFIQSTSCSSKSTGASGAPALAGIGFQASGAQTITSPNAFYCWVFVGGGGLIDTYANGGIRLLIGQDLSNYRYWYVDGSDYFPYIGWQCIAIETDNAVVAATSSVGAPSSTKQYFGAIFNCKINISKGNPMAVDAVRWGRTITVTAGDLANGYATFAGIAGTNDSINNRYGQFQAIAGGYQLQGRLALGSAGTAVDFRDSNASIVTAVSRKVAASFNAIEVLNASSRVDWDSIAWSSLGTVSRGTFTVTDNADVNIVGCSFTGLSTFALKAATDILTSIFRQCDTVTAPGSNLTGSQFLLPRVAADTSAVVWDANVDTDGKLDRTTFSKGTNAHHAVELGTTSPTTVTLRGITFSGFNAANANNDSTIHVKRTTGTVTINLIGCSGNISYKTAGATVALVTNPVTLAVHVQDINSGASIENARVWVPVTSTAGGKPYQAAVTITRSGTTATVAHTSHGLSTNDWVWIAGCTGADGALYNGTFQITWISANSYSYTMTGTPSGSAAGAPAATFVVLNGLTNSSGNISASYSWNADQPVSGRARRASGAYGTLYRTGPASGTISSTGGLAITVALIPDT